MPLTCVANVYSFQSFVVRSPFYFPPSLIVFFFQYEIVEVWLSTRGSVCPITNTALSKADLEPDDDLRNRIKRYHIQQTSLRSTAMPDDDLYDFWSPSSGTMIRKLLRCAWWWPLWLLVTVVRDDDSKTFQLSSTICCWQGRWPEFGGMCLYLFLFLPTLSLFSVSLLCLLSLLRASPSGWYSKVVVRSFSALRMSYLPWWFAWSGNTTVRTDRHIAQRK